MNIHLFVYNYIIVLVVTFICFADLFMESFYNPTIVFKPFALMFMFINGFIIFSHFWAVFPFVSFCVADLFDCMCHTVGIAITLFFPK